MTVVNWVNAEQKRFDTMVSLTQAVCDELNKLVAASNELDYPEFTVQRFDNGSLYNWIGVDCGRFRFMFELDTRKQDNWRLKASGLCPDGLEWGRVYYGYPKPSRSWKDSTSPAKIAREFLGEVFLPYVRWAEKRIEIENERLQKIADNRKSSEELMDYFGWFRDHGTRLEMSQFKGGDGVKFGYVRFDIDCESGSTNLKCDYLSVEDIEVMMGALLAHRMSKGVEV